MNAGQEEKKKVVICTEGEVASCQQERHPGVFKAAPAPSPFWSRSRFLLAKLYFSRGVRYRKGFLEAKASTGGGGNEKKKSRSVEKSEGEVPLGRKRQLFQLGCFFFGNN